MTEEPVEQFAAASGAHVAGRRSWTQKLKIVAPRVRPVWSIPILIAVGVFSSLRYPLSEPGTFYSTAASVIATLYVAIALGVFAVKESSDNRMKFDHWVFIVASSAGLLASLRGISVGHVHDTWQTRLLTGLAVVGVTAAIVLVAERLVTWRGGAGNWQAIVWTALFVIVAVALAIFP